MKILLSFENRFMNFCKYEKFKQKTTPDTMYEISVYYKKTTEPVIYYASFVNAEDVLDICPGDGDMYVGLRKGTICGKVYRGYNLIEDAYFINDDTKSEQEIFDEYYKNDKYIERVTYKKINMRNWCKKYYDLSKKFENKIEYITRYCAEKASKQIINKPNIEHLLNDNLTFDEIQHLGLSLYENSNLMSLGFIQNRLQISQQQISLYNDNLTDKTLLFLTVPCKSLNDDEYRELMMFLLQFNIVQPDSRCTLNYNIREKEYIDLNTTTYTFELVKDKKTFFDKKWKNSHFILDTCYENVLTVTYNKPDDDVMVRFTEEPWKTQISYLQSMFLKGIVDILWPDFESKRKDKETLELLKQQIIKQFEKSMHYLKRISASDYIVKLNNEG